MAEGTDKAVAETEGDAKAAYERLVNDYKTLEANHKSVQRALNKAQARSREASEVALKNLYDNPASRVEDRLDNLEKLLAEIHTDYKPKFEENLAKASQRRDYDKKVTEVTTTFQKLVDEAGIDLDDPEYEDIHDAYTSGSFKLAEKMIKRVMSRKVESKSDEVKKEALKSAKVDSGEPVTTVAAKPKLESMLATDVRKASPKDLDSLRDNLRSAVEDLTKTRVPK